MNGVFERFVSQVVRQTDVNPEEYEDLSEELLSHLQCSFEDLRIQGFSKEEAEKMAMMNFGDKKEVGKQLQQAMYPYRREMMLVLAGASLLYAYSVYLLQLFTRSDAHIIWLVLAVLVSSTILTVTLRPVESLNRRLWMNVLLIGHIAVFTAGSMLAGGLEMRYSVILTIFSYLIILLAIILVYRTTIYDFPSSRQPSQKHAKWIHFINITIGILLTAVTLFVIWGLLAFGGAEGLVFYPLLAPLAVWAVLYAVQLYLLARQKKRSAFAIAILEVVLIAGAVISWVVMINLL